jgi:hypothetical protein
MYDNDTPSWSFAPIAASGSTLALLLSHDTQKPTSALPRSAYTILIQKYGAQELVAIGDTNGEPVASLEFNTFPLPDRIQLGSGAPTLPLSTWWKREESKVVYKRCKTYPTLYLYYNLLIHHIRTGTSSDRSVTHTATPFPGADVQSLESGDVGACVMRSC